MAREQRHFAVTVPAGTPIASPQSSDVSFPAREVVKVTWRFPPGCAGLVGFYLAMGGAPVLPLPAGTWITDDDHDNTWDTHGQPNSGQWQVVAYNTGIYQHTVRFTFHLDLIAPGPHLIPKVELADLFPVPDLSQAGPPVTRRPA